MIRPILASLAATALIAPVAIHAQQVEIEAEGPVIELTVVETVKAVFPHLKILARAQDRPHTYELIRAGADCCSRSISRWVSRK